MNPEKVSIVIPALNEGEVIGSVVANLRKEIPGAEVVVINDGSSDNTKEEAEKNGARVVSHDYQRGYGAGLKTGTRSIDRDYIIFCDADGQHRSEDVKKLIDECDGYDLVVGARGGDSHRPLIRRPGKLIMSKWAEFLAGRKIPDLNSGLRIFKREILLKYLHLMPDGFSFSTTSTFAIMKSNRRFKYVPIKVEKRVGQSTVSQWKHGPQTLMLILRLAVLFEPLKVFLMVSGGLFTLSILSFVIDLFSGGGLLSGGGIADTTVLLVIATIVIFMSGLLCDQVSAMRRERHE